VLNKQTKLRIKKHKLHRIACRDREYRENDRSLKDLMTMVRWRTTNQAVRNLLQYAEQSKILAESLVTPSLGWKQFGISRFIAEPGQLNIPWPKEQTLVIPMKRNSNAEQTSQESDSSEPT
jgi:hypothetical protein